ncbi:hypothetical protein BDV59DRAFT_194395 [Aspergillus ambiguus]|uniref:glycoside hydrolase family 154 protein n=1 Tax=Aspergillus ambiguus TaxID=176160 RepID=UPI003CCCE212
MSPLPGFTDNPFQSRSDLVRAAVALLSALEPYKSKSKARIKIPVATAAGFDDTAAQLEGFARPLWVVPFLFGERSGDRVDLNSWIQGLEAGTDPNSAEYWGDLGKRDQRMVEMESISFALLVQPGVFLGSMSDVAKTNLVNWLRQINDHIMPQNNWLWFRVFVNLALVKRLGVPRSEVQHQVEADLKTLDSFRTGGGWSSDGLWGDNRKQSDYYSGSFAIQFAQMLYVLFAGHDDEARAEEYRRLAKEFGAAFWRYFDQKGAAIPFGRSMTYRFAFAAFWSSVACAGVQLPSPFDEAGAIKGMLLRHLRWWSRHPDIFNSDGTLNIGFTYPNMYLSEAYNSPQSVYWCLKSFIVLLLPESHHFWSSAELSHPLTGLSNLGSAERIPISPIDVVWPPRHILNSTPEHHFLLSSGQMTNNDHKARESKYGKFAYSSAFGFSVPTGSLLHQLAPDSTLCVSHDGGETWKLRSKPQDERILNIRVAKGDSTNGVMVPSLASVWRPWNYMDLEIKSVLIPLAERFPGWHVRVHRVVWDCPDGLVPWVDAIRIVDGGFSLHAETASGWSKDTDSCLLKSCAGVSGIFDMEVSIAISGNRAKVKSQCFALKPDPNTNLMASRTLIPVIQHEIPISLFRDEGQGTNAAGGLCLASGIFAVSESAGLSPDMIHTMWLNRPQLHVNIDRNSIEIAVS